MNNTGTTEYSPWWVLLENLLIGAMLVFGFLGMRFVSISGLPLLSTLWAAFLLIMLGYVLRRTLCRHCKSFGKLCHCGWGRYARLVTKPGTPGKYPLPWLGGLVWGIFMGLPILIMLSGVLAGSIMIADILPFLIPFFVLVIINSVLHVKDCRACCMRAVCPGSAAKAS